jgi:hypothetical protein
MLTISITNVEISQSKVYFKERAFFLKKKIIIPKKKTIPIIKK